MKIEEQPLVTVIIPSFNHAQYIDEAVESVFAQSYERWELIIVDDGSSDGTADVLKKYEGVPGVTVIMNRVNRGQSYAVNRALEIAEGQFISFLPSDDWFLPQKLQLQVAKFLTCSAEVGVVYGRGARFFEDTGQTLAVELPLYRGRVLRHLVEEGNFVYPATPMFRSECFTYSPFDETYRAEGEAIYLRIAQKYEFEYVEQTVAVMRDHSYNTGKNIDMMYEDNFRYWTEFFSRPGLPKEITDLRSARIAKLQRMTGLTLIAMHMRMKEGRKMLVRAIITRPTLLLDPRVIGGIGISILPRALRPARFQ